MEERSDDAPKGRALTMTDGHLSDLRGKASLLHGWPSFGLNTQKVFMDLLAELDATRAALAQAERERDEANEHYLDATTQLSATELALAAREAENAEMRAALGTVMEMVRLWHGMGMDTVSEQRAWKLYEEGAPEWQPLRDLRDRPPGSDAALRAMLLEAAHAERERWVSKMHGPADVVASALAQWDAEILASLLPPATQAQEGVAE